MVFYYESEDEIRGGGIPNKLGRLINKRLPSEGNRVYSVETAPTVEPVSVDDLKTFSRIDYDAEDMLLEGFIKAIRQAAEKYTGRAFIDQTIAMKMDYWPGRVIELPRPPLISVTKVATLDEDDTETEFSSDYYYTVKSKDISKLILKQSVTEPVNTARDYGGFLIRYQAGYGTAATDVPDDIREGIKAWVSVFQATRTYDPKKPPPEVRVFLDQYRLITTIIR